MRKVEENPLFVVFDDALTPEEFRAVWRHVQMENYRPVHEGTWHKEWRLTDGVPLAGRPVLSNREPSAAYPHPDMPELKDVAYAPTNSPMDVVVDRLSPSGTLHRLLRKSVPVGAANSEGVTSGR